MLNQLHDLYNAVSSPEVAGPLFGAIANAAAMGSKVGASFGQPVIGAAVGGAFALAAIGTTMWYLMRQDSQPALVPVRTNHNRNRV